MEWLGAGEPDSSGLVGRVDDLLDVGEKLRRFLNFIDENGGTVALEEERGVFLRRLQDSGLTTNKRSKVQAGKTQDIGQGWLSTAYRKTNCMSCEAAEYIPAGNRF